jgi:hypothetical protein
MTNRVRSSHEWHESEAQSFIVKIWLDTTETGTRRPKWHGSITHVPGGERQHVSDVTEISMLIAQQLRILGVDLGLKWRLWLWLFCL